MESFVAREAAEYHLDPYLPQSQLPESQEAEEIGALRFPTTSVGDNAAMINGRAYRFETFFGDQHLVDTDVWWVEFRGGSSKNGASDMYSGRFWREKLAVTWTVQGNGYISNTSNVSTDGSTSFLAGRGSNTATNTSGGLNTAFYIFKRLERMWIATPHWTSLFGSLQDADRNMRIMRRR